MSHDVPLPRTRNPKFPDNCVVCGTARPGHTTRFTCAESQWWHFFVPIWWLWFWGSRHRVRVPACHGCALRLQIWRFCRGVLLLGAAVAALLLYGKYVGYPTNRLLRKIVFLGVGIAGCLPFFAAAVVFPPAFDMTVSEKGVLYEFGSEKYAEGFAMLNDGYVE